MLCLMSYHYEYTSSHQRALGDSCTPSIFPILAHCAETEIITANSLPIYRFYCFYSQTNTMHSVTYGGNV